MNFLSFIPLTYSAMNPAQSARLNPNLKNRIFATYARFMENLSTMMCLKPVRKSRYDGQHLNLRLLSSKRILDEFQRYVDYTKGYHFDHVCCSFSIYINEAYDVRKNVINFILNGRNLSIVCAGVHLFYIPFEEIPNIDLLINTIGKDGIEHDDVAYLLKDLLTICLELSMYESCMVIDMCERYLGDGTLKGKMNIIGLGSKIFKKRDFKFSLFNACTIAVIVYELTGNIIEIFNKDSGAKISIILTHRLNFEMRYDPIYVGKYGLSVDIFVHYDFRHYWELLALLIDSRKLEFFHLDYEVSF
jgi:hypothetical protein